MLIEKDSKNLHTFGQNSHLVNTCSGDFHFTIQCDFDTSQTSVCVFWWLCTIDIFENIFITIGTQKLFTMSCRCVLWRWWTRELVTSAPDVLLNNRICSPVWFLIWHSFDRLWNHKVTTTFLVLQWIEFIWVYPRRNFFRIYFLSNSYPRTCTIDNSLSNINNE